MTTQIIRWGTMALFLTLMIQLPVLSLSAQSTSKLLKQARKKFKLPALAITIMSADSIYFQEIQGTHMAHFTQSVQLDDYFHIGSCAKSILALIAAKYVEAEKISWDTPFFALLPELKSQANPAFLAITLEDLLLCRAGIQAYVSGEEPLPDLKQGETKPGHAFALNLLGQEAVAPRMSDGKFEHLYSNASYVLAAMMLEKVSGHSYRELIDQYMVQGLGLPVYMGFPNRLHPDQPWGHLMQGSSLQDFPPGHAYRIPDLLMPAGDMSMSPIDFGTYVQLHLKGLSGIDTFISSRGFQYLHFCQEGFALGVANGTLAGYRFSGMDGSAGTFFCRAVLIPEADLAFTLMTNAGNGTGRMKAIDWLSRKIVKKKFGWWWKFWM